MKLWKAYKGLIAKNLALSDQHTAQTLPEWRNLLFYKSLLIIIPLCLIAILPGIYLSLKHDLPGLAIFDGFIFILLFVTGLVPGIQLKYRKAVFIAGFYSIPVTLLIYIGLMGPGILYLYAACIFAILFSQAKYAHWWSVLNLAICVVFTGLIYWNLMPQNEFNQIDSITWLTVSTNLVILSFISSALIPRLFNGLDQTILQQNIATKNLKAKQLELNTTLETLSAKNKELEHFVHAASHDIKEPIRMVTSFLKQLEKKYAQSLDDRARKYIAFANQGADRMAHIINDLYEYSTIEDDSRKLEYVNLTELLAEITLFNQNIITAKKAKINYPENLPTIKTIKTPLYLTLHNLIANGLKYHRKDTAPEIKIDFEEHSHTWLFKVHDNGIGINEEYFEKIFIIFQRLHTQDEYMGTGIGLATVKKSIEKLGGKIWVTSTPGKGSTFYFEISKH